MAATLSEALALAQRSYPVRRRIWPEGDTVIFVRGSLPADADEEMISGIPRALFVIGGDQLVMPLYLRGGQEWRPETDDLFAADWVAESTPLAEETMIARSDGI